MSFEQYIYAYVAKEEQFQDNEYIIQEGSKGDWAFVILKGRVKVKKMTAKGIVTIDNLKDGDIFGEMIFWASGKGTRTASVVADGPVTLGILDTVRLLKEYESLSPSLKSIMRSLIIRLSGATKKAAVLAVETNWK